MAAASPRVVVIGGGFGGLALAQSLAGHAEITLVDRRNHHLFQPLLYQVATAALSPAEIAQPIRSVLRGSDRLTVLLDEATGVDREARDVHLQGGGRLAYDALVVACGVQYNYFGHADWAEHAPSLKSLPDALDIRRRLLLAFENAESCPDPVRRRILMTFVLVGGGPTGVEMAGSIAELARHALRRDFRHIDPASARIVLVEAGSRLLPGFPDRLAAYAKRTLERLGVEVRLSSAIQDVQADGVMTAGGPIAAGLVIWCAGVRGTPPAGWLGIGLSKQGTVPVAPDLSVPGVPDIFVIGDLAHVEDARGRPLPQVGPVAKQQGAYVAAVLKARFAGQPPPAAFAYRNPGSLAIIGRSAAVADFGWLRLTGLIGWLVWSLAHIFFLIGFRNRGIVFLTWAWEWLTYGRGARLIAEAPRAQSTPAAN